MHPFYSNMIVILMSLFMCMSGVLLTALAYRPKEISEEWWQWTERFYKSEISRVAGPVLIVISLVLHVTSVTYCVLKRLRRARAEAKVLRGRAEDTESLETQRSCTELEPDQRLETQCLLGERATGDIACFPDGSLRSSRKRLRTASENASVAASVIEDSLLSDLSSEAEVKNRISELSSVVRSEDKSMIDPV